MLKNKEILLAEDKILVYLRFISDSIRRSFEKFKSTHEQRMIENQSSQGWDNIINLVSYTELISL